MSAVLRFLFLYFHFVIFIYLSLSPFLRSVLGKCGVICDNKINMQRPWTSGQWDGWRTTYNKKAPDTAEWIIKYMNRWNSLNGCPDIYKNSLQIWCVWRGLSPFSKTTPSRHPNPTKAGLHQGRFPVLELPRPEFHSSVGWLRSAGDVPIWHFCKEELANTTKSRCGLLRLLTKKAECCNKMVL